MNEGFWEGLLKFGPVSGWVLILMLFGTLIKVWPALKKLQIEGDSSLRNDLFERIESLEQTLHNERQACERKIENLQANFNGLLRQFITLQIAMGGALPPSEQSPVGTAVLDQLINRLGYPDPNKQLEEK